LNFLSTNKKIALFFLFASLLGVGFHFAQDFTTIDYYRSGRPAGHHPEEVCLISCYGERHFFYAVRGAWLRDNLIPFKDIFSEYPQIATYFFGLPYLVSNDKSTYYLVFMLMVIWCFVFLLLVVNKFKFREKYHWFLFFMPGFLFFTINRFDILPSLLCMSALYLLTIERNKLSFSVLAVAVFTKWYPAVVFPIFVLYLWRKKGKLPLAPLVCFLVTSVIIVAPTFIAGGFEAFWVPYKWHLARSYNEEGLFYILHVFSTKAFSYNIDNFLFKKIFLLMQFSGCLFVCTRKIDTIDKLFQTAMFSILTFASFAVIFSPQWLIWLTPLLMFTIKDKKDLVLWISFDVINYVHLAIIYRMLGGNSTVNRYVVFLRVIILMVFVGRMFMQVSKIEPIKFKLKKMLLFN